jgi:hypothetical protein
MVPEREEAMMNKISRMLRLAVLIAAALPAAGLALSLTEEPGINR